MRALEPYVRPVLLAFSTCLWLFEALLVAVEWGRPLLGVVMVLLAAALFQTIGWEMFLPMRDYSCRVTPPPRAEVVKPPMPPVDDAEDRPSPNRSRRLLEERISRLQLQRWPCAPTVH